MNLYRERVLLRGFVAHYCKSSFSYPFILARNSELQYVLGMSEFCGSCSKKMGAPSKYWEYGDFGYLLSELKVGNKADVICEGCGRITYRKIGGIFRRTHLEIVENSD